ncbi:MAG: LysM peptidoglycan-binding domain-containing protein [Acidiferrobacterales bacterium]
MEAEAPATAVPTAPLADIVTPVALAIPTMPSAAEPEDALTAELDVVTDDDGGEQAVTDSSDNADEWAPDDDLGTGVILMPSGPEYVSVNGVEDDAVAEEAPAHPLRENSEPAQYENIWDRIRAGLQLPTLDDPKVAYHERWFLSNPKYMQRKMQRARLYLYHIVEEVERRGFPMEIALLPAIESAYHPHAYSHARAMGLWQFIAPTARRYGLKINWWYDGRRDIVASTTAALNYLEALHAHFDGDWHLALAAYNAGERKIERAIRYNERKSLPTNYSRLAYLRAETRHYVPKLMAMVNIVSNPHAYGIELPPIPNAPYFVRVDVGAQVDLKVVADLAQMPVGDFFDINPGFRRWATDPNGPHQVLIPIEKKARLIEGLANLADEARIQWRRHRVRRGDTLSTVARRYGVSVWAIKRANNLRSSLIRVGQSLVIPISSRPVSARLANITRPLPVSRPRGVRAVHYVRRGETLYSIARKYRVYVKQLARWNRMHPRDTLHIGRRLKIW